MNTERRREEEEGKKTEQKQQLEYNNNIQTTCWRFFSSHGLNSHADICTCVSLETLYKDIYIFWARARSRLSLWLHAFISLSLACAHYSFFCVRCFSLCAQCIMYTFHVWVRRRCYCLFASLYLLFLLCCACARACSRTVRLHHYINIYSIALARDPEPHFNLVLYR